MANLLKKQKRQEEEIKDPTEIFKLKKKNTQELAQAEELLEKNKKEELIIEEKDSSLAAQRKTKQKPKPKKEEVDINQYKDPEGLTLKKLSFGLWIVEHRAFMLTLLYGFLGFVGVVTWGFFLYGMGGYLIFGMRADNKIIQELIYNAQVDHAVILEQAPKGLQFNNVQVVKLPENKYDFLIKVTNPNTHHWAEFNYYFQVGGSSFGYNSGYVLPEESKYFFVLGEELAVFPSRVEFKIENMSWGRISKTKYPDWPKFYEDHLRLEVTDKEFVPAPLSELSEKEKLNVLKFNITNNTAYSYWRVDSIVLLMNRSNIIGAEKVVLDKLMAGETRDVRVTWPGTMGKVSEIIVNPRVNIIDNTVYIRPDGGVGEEK